MFKRTKKVDASLLAEAAEWLMEMQDGGLNEEQYHQFQQWKNQSPLHQQAWQQAEQLQHCLQHTPAKLTQQILEDNQQQKLSQKFLFIPILLGGFGFALFYANQQAMFADYRTQYGKQQHIILEDGSKIIINNHTAIDIQYSATQRHIKLHYGEIFIQTAKDPDRPFRVLAKHGSIQALGTQFDVTQQQDHTRVAVLEHAVRIDTIQGQQQRLEVGQQVQFSAEKINMHHQINPLDYAWHNSLMVADRLTLQKFAKQVEKNYGINIQLATNSSQLIISGTYPANDLEALLSSLAQAYNLKIERGFFGNKIIISKNN